MHKLEICKLIIKIDNFCNALKFLEIVSAILCNLLGVMALIIPFTVIINIIKIK